MRLPLLSPRPRAPGGVEGGAGARQVGTLSRQGAAVSDQTASDPSVDLWLASLDDLAAPLGDLERADPLHPSAADDEGLNGSRRVARSLLRRLIARRFGRTLAAQPFTAGPFGKPLIAGLGGDFNLSHTTEADGRSFALIGLGPVAAIGVDLEPARTVRLDDRRRDLIIAAALRVGEGAVLPDLPASRVLQAWARLEAWGKADGRGIGRTLTQFGIWGRGTAGTAGAALAAAGEGLVVHDIDAGPGLFAAVALPQGVRPPKLRFVPTDLPSLQALIAAAGSDGNSGVDLAPGAGQKGTVRSVAQPG